MARVEVRKTRVTQQAGKRFAEYLIELHRADDEEESTVMQWKRWSQCAHFGKEWSSTGPTFPQEDFEDMVVTVLSPVNGAKFSDEYLSKRAAALQAYFGEYIAVSCERIVSFLREDSGYRTSKNSITIAVPSTPPHGKTVTAVTESPSGVDSTLDAAASVRASSARKRLFSDERTQPLLLLAILLFIIAGVLAPYAIAVVSPEARTQAVADKEAVPTTELSSPHSHSTSSALSAQNPLRLPPIDKAALLAAGGTAAAALLARTLLPPATVSRSPPAVASPLVLRCVSPRWLKRPPPDHCRGTCLQHLPAAPACGTCLRHLGAAWPRLAT